MWPTFSAPGFLTGQGLGRTLCSIYCIWAGPSEGRRGALRGCLGREYPLGSWLRNGPTGWALGKEAFVTPGSEGPSGDCSVPSSSRGLGSYVCIPAPVASRRKGIVKLNIYFQEFNYRTIEESAANNVSLGLLPLCPAGGSGGSPAPQKH